MAKALFVSKDEISRYTALNGNVDADKIIPFLKIAQDTSIQNFLGQDLFTKMSNDIVGSGLSGDYLTLNNEYVKPMLVHWAMVAYLPWAAYQVSNKGMYKHSSEDSDTVSKSEIDAMIEREQVIAQGYTQRFIDYMALNEELFPEYKTNGIHKVQPDTTQEFGGWMLD